MKYKATVAEMSDLLLVACKARSFPEGIKDACEDEAVAPGFPLLRVKGGPCARVKLTDWPNHLDEIGAIFDELMRNFPMAPNAPTLEYYRSQSELHLLLPLAEGAQDGEAPAIPK